MSRTRGRGRSVIRGGTSGPQTRARSVVPRNSILTRMEDPSPAPMAPITPSRHASSSPPTARANRVLPFAFSHGRSSSNDRVDYGDPDDITPSAAGLILPFVPPRINISRSSLPRAEPLPLTDSYQSPFNQPAPLLPGYLPPSVTSICLLDPSQRASSSTLPELPLNTNRLEASIVNSNTSAFPPVSTSLAAFPATEVAAAQEYVASLVEGNTLPPAKTSARCRADASLTTQRSPKKRKGKNKATNSLQDRVAESLHPAPLTFISAPRSETASGSLPIPSRLTHSPSYVAPDALLTGLPHPQSGEIPAPSPFHGTGGRSLAYATPTPFAEMKGFPHSLATPAPIGGMVGSFDHRSTMPTPFHGLDGSRTRPTMPTPFHGMDGSRVPTPIHGMDGERAPNPN
ncbi:hypothetical protein C0991_012117 [Blastosporella zonata]|nr:hypothetical protein C0991_012117 [Blastosporella zonata]